MEEAPLGRRDREAGPSIHVFAIREFDEAKNDRASDSSDDQADDSLPSGGQETVDQERSEKNAKATGSAVDARDWQKQCERGDEDAAQVDETKDGNGDEHDSGYLQWVETEGEHCDSHDEKRQRAEVLDFLGELEHAKCISFGIHPSHEGKGVRRRQSNLQPSWCEQRHCSPRPQMPKRSR